MTDSISLTGLVATDPRNIVTSEGLAITSFRLASTQRRYDKTQSKWVDAETNWYTITTFRQLALNAAASVHKGERVVVSGRLRIRSWDNGEKTGMNVDVEADALGHDLAWGTTAFNRTMVSSSSAGGDPVESAPLATGSPAEGMAHAPVSDEAQPLVDAGATPVPF
ncbi:single-stranded DNA-binding protein [Salinibacterium soli]|uniref:Single-stranded DNA-binding protein n=1 Tax=Antiquaquibacter soli TaxID=3064523 RepID=A0ABT9BMU7_9MICO|nr:single-stranded DNA-binding protein [Protaetiibacter sp. WY-16]MDO7882358.1 single-stranded DNA-binding protein [Protaetiibacter sp. WY-16]